MLTKYLLAQYLQLYDIAIYDICRLPHRASIKKMHYKYREFTKIYLLIAYGTYIDFINFHLKQVIWTNLYFQSKFRERDL